MAYSRGSRRPSWDPGNDSENVGIADSPIDSDSGGNNISPHPEYDTHPPFYDEDAITDSSSVSSSALSRIHSLTSVVSYASDVVMATNEGFAGALASSVPSSASAFSSRRRLSSASRVFGFSDSDDEAEEGDEDDEQDQERSLSGIEEGTEPEDSSSGREFPSSEEILPTPFDVAPNMEAGDLRGPQSPRPGHERKVSGLRRRRRRASRSSTSTLSGTHLFSSHTKQELYLASEDLSIVITGYQTSKPGQLLYSTLCILTFGLAFLLFRWLPRKRVSLIGKRCALREADWVVVRSQWGDVSILNVKKQEYGLSLSSVFGASQLRRVGSGNEHSDQDEKILDVLKTIDYRYIRLCFHPLKERFLMISGWKDPAWTTIRSIKHGLDIKDREIRERVFGSNLIDIEEKSTTKLLVDEVLHPFYIFQLASLILWSLDEYYYYATCIFLISFGSIIATLVETKATMRRMREVSRYECDVPVLKNGFWGLAKSSELVPGDIFDVSGLSLPQLPCDCLLLTGDCIVNESMLTGESIPISKFAATDRTLEQLHLDASTLPPEVASHVLFAGTKIIRIRKPILNPPASGSTSSGNKSSEGTAIALVLRTGFNTTKGALVRSMLFPKPSGFKFYRDSFRYISVMAAIAFLGFIATLVNFIELGLPVHLIIVRALDLITIVVPPALPATLTIGTSFALMRLKKKQIFCISPQRVNVGGKLDIVCFDKTGTLTEDGLDVLGVQCVSSNGEWQPEMKDDVLFAMATCHSLKNVGDDLVGDPLDKMMFDYTGWKYHESHDGMISPDDLTEPEDGTAMTESFALIAAQQTSIALEPGPEGRMLTVVKSYEFISQLRRASVVVRHPDNAISVFVKGAPESISSICRAESFPEDYAEQLSYYTRTGYRVIALAGKSMGRIGWIKLNKIDREEAESDLDFLGFIIFENKLKVETKPAIRELEAANIRTVMCTGDNILTAISVGRESGIINPETIVFAPRFADGDALNPLSRISWECVDKSGWALDEHTLLPIYPSDVSADEAIKCEYALAVNGDVFRWIIDYASDTILDNMLITGKIFARMSPDEKHELVEKLQSRDYTCAFCGDGANDCGALKAADVGISLSEAEASVAAPFTSRVFDISCVPEVIKEGRAALVTSFSCFKYMSLYSAIQFITVSFLYASAANLGDFQYLFIDLFLILPIAIFMGWSKPFPVLSTKRPTASLVSYKVLVPLLGQIALCGVIQTVVFVVVRRQPWFQPPATILGLDAHARNSENTALFLVSSFQYILSAAVLSIGPPFRQPMVKNVPFMLAMASTLGLALYLLFGPAPSISDLMELTEIPRSFQWFLFASGMVGFLISYWFEKSVFPKLATRLKRSRGAGGVLSIMKTWVKSVMGVTKHSSTSSSGERSTTPWADGYDPIPSSDGGPRKGTVRHRKRYKVIQSQLGLLPCT